MRSTFTISKNEAVKLDLDNLTNTKDLNYPDKKFMHPINLVKGYGGTMYVHKNMMVIIFFMVTIRSETFKRMVV